MTLNEIIDAAIRSKHATDAGTRMHAALRRVVINENGDDLGDPELIQHLRHNDLLCDLFHPQSRTEVPIAGRISGRFISRRIDRMRVFDDRRCVIFIDYKTDLVPDLLRPQYHAQLKEYAALLRDVYPGYDVCGYILWTHDWTVEPVVGHAKKS